MLMLLRSKLDPFVLRLLIFQERREKLTFLGCRLLLFLVFDKLGEQFQHVWRIYIFWLGRCKFGLFGADIVYLFPLLSQRESGPARYRGGHINVRPSYRGLPG